MKYSLNVYKVEYKVTISLFLFKGSKLKYITINYKWFLVSGFLRYLDFICSYLYYILFIFYLSKYIRIRIKNF